MHWGDYGSGMGYSFMGFGWLFMTLWGVLALLGIVYLIKLLAGGDRKKQLEESSLDILKRRYAKGEVTKEEFEKIKDDLKKD